MSSGILYGEVEGKSLDVRIIWGSVRELYDIRTGDHKDNHMVAMFVCMGKCHVRVGMASWGKHEAALRVIHTESVIG